MGHLRLVDEAVRVLEPGLQACADARRDTRRRSFFASAHRVHFRRRILIRADLLCREALALATRLRRRCDHGRGGVRRLALRLFHPSTLRRVTLETLALDRFKIHLRRGYVTHIAVRSSALAIESPRGRPIVSVAPQTRAMSAKEGGPLGALPAELVGPPRRMVERAVMRSSGDGPFRGRARGAARRRCR